jgi:putative component of membrane protein insertase Oxa1/YidC/SpoIIIJ protein YidD
MSRALWLSTRSFILHQLPHTQDNYPGALDLAPSNAGLPGYGDYGQGVVRCLLWVIKWVTLRARHNRTFQSDINEPPTWKLTPTGSSLWMRNNTLVFHRMLSSVRNSVCGYVRNCSQYATLTASDRSPWSLSSGWSLCPWRVKEWTCFRCHRNGGCGSHIPLVAVSSVLFPSRQTCSSQGIIFTIRSDSSEVALLGAAAPAGSPLPSCMMSLVSVWVVGLG